MVKVQAMQVQQGVLVLLALEPLTGHSLTEARTTWAMLTLLLSVQSAKPFIYMEVGEAKPIFLNKSV